MLQSFKSKNRDAPASQQEYIVDYSQGGAEETGSMAHSTTERTASPIGENDPRWQAVSRRDRAADGSFVYAVRTTGVFCRPSCAARRPLLRNVAFYGNPAAAVQAGYRPCKRCHPIRPLEGPEQSLVVRVCRLLEASATIPSLSELALEVGLSPFHLHRLFKRATSLTPRAYAQALRANRARSALRGGQSVTASAYDAGYESSSRFYAAADQLLGMTPSQYRAGGAETEIHFAVADCWLGCVLVAATERGVCAVLMGDDPEKLVHDLERRFSRALLVGDDRRFEHLVASVVALIQNPSATPPLPLDIRGTAFQERVWRALTQVPPGRTVTYQELAAMVGAPSGARAVARACAQNPIAVAVPCHRVVRTDGSVSGYRWGVERKRQLLARERDNAGEAESRRRVAERRNRP